MTTANQIWLTVLSLIIMVDIAAIAFAPNDIFNLLPHPSNKGRGPTEKSPLLSDSYLRLIPSQVRGHRPCQPLRTSTQCDANDKPIRGDADATSVTNTNTAQTKPPAARRSKQQQHQAHDKHNRFGNTPDIEWQAISMDHLRSHPRFDPLPTHVSSLTCLEDARYFRQDSWQWDALHVGRCTTSQAAAALGFLEPLAGEFLEIPRSWRRGGVGAYERMRARALRTLEEMQEELSCDYGPPSQQQDEGALSWFTPKNPNFPFAARFLHLVTEEERERRRNQFGKHPVHPVAVKMMWGNTQEATALLTALNYFWKEHEPEIRMKEVGMCGAGLSENATSALLIGASPDALFLYPNGTIEVVEVKNHCPFVSTNGRSNKKFMVREMPFREPYLPPLYVSQMMMEMKCVGPDCRSAVMVRQTATAGALILRLYRDDAWIDEMYHWLTTFQQEFVDNETPPPPNFFWHDERYRRFVHRTKELGSSVEVLKHVPHQEIQRMQGKSRRASSLFLD